MRIKKLGFRGDFNFLGLPTEDTAYENAKAVILPVPYDSTTSYRAGTRQGPQAIIMASRNVELFDQKLNCEPLVSGVHTLPELEPDMSSPMATIAKVEKVVKTLCLDGKLPVMIGGEHSLTTGAVRALKKTLKEDFSVLQLDAHADLRDSFEDTPFNHACAMRRVMETVEVVQVGIRNISKEEMEFARKKQLKNIFWAEEIQNPNGDWISKVINKLKKKVYITIDLDVFDPSLMPAVGTPEPGGLSWYCVTNLLDTVVQNHDIIGFDVMELCPISGNISPDFVAAKLIFHVLGRIFVKNNWVAIK